MGSFFRDHTSRSIKSLFPLRKMLCCHRSASGIGAGIIKRLAEAGSSVVVADLDLEQAEKTYKRFQKSPE